MQKNDILDNFLEDDNQEKIGSRAFAIDGTKEGFVVTIFASDEDENTELTEEDRIKAQEGAVRKLEETRLAFIEFSRKAKELKTYFPLYSAIANFAEFASAFTEFVEDNLDMLEDEDEYETTELSEFIGFKTALILKAALLKESLGENE